MTGYSVPLLPWICAVGRKTVERGVYVYEGDEFSVVIGTSNASIYGEPLVRVSLTLYREGYEDSVCEGSVFDVVDYAARELREVTDLGYVER